MNIGIVIPGHSSDEGDWAIPLLRRLIAALAQRHNVRVLALRYPHRRDRYTLDGADVIALGWAQATGVKRLALWQDALRMLARLDREQPFDVLHGMWADETGALTVWAGRRLQVPSVVSVLGGELVWLPDIRYGLQQSRFSRWIVTQALHADAVIASCSYVERQLATHVSSTRMHRIAFGIDSQQFTADGDYDPRHLFHVGSLIGVKDQPTLLRALSLLPSDVTLDIAGIGTDEAALKQLASEVGVAERVRWLGKVGHLDLPSHYRRAALHVMTSRHETGPMSVLEAAACGTPSVGTRVGMLSDDLALGIAVPAQDPQALAQALWSLLDNPVRLTEARKAARATVEARYTIEQMAQATEAMYHELSNK
ncbi:MAG: glycosyltransferase family 4 protein [Chloroflexota bacterium]|nr:glycosyltransferase family 4 protein [Chloroflexota bacterium]